MRKVVLDTNIYISALFWKGKPYQIVQQALNKEITVYISEQILAEIDNVLERDFGIEEDKRKETRNAILLFTNLVVPTKKLDIVKDDPDDNCILECALEAEAETIISQDKHLLKIREYENIRIQHPEEFFTETK